MGHNPGWRHDWQDEGHTAGYSRIPEKLERLLKARHADDVLALGEELLRSGTRQVEESHDATEIQMGVVNCMQVVVQALGQSSMVPAARLGLAMDAVLKAKYGLCEAFVEYLYRRHPKTAWDHLADQLLTRLKSSKPAQGPDDFSSSYTRDRLSNWTIHALERAGRTEEIIPLCEAEARATGNYERLVTRLMAAGRDEDADRWIREGFRCTKKKYPGTSAGLYDKLKDIRARQKDWPALAALEVDGFVRQPSPRGFAECKKAATKINIWDKVRAGLLEYLKKGALPWKQKGWPLPETGFDRPEGARKDVFPMVNELIRIAIAEQNPAQVLFWYDHPNRKGFGWFAINEEEIAAAVQTHFPDRAVAIRKKKAEELIAQVTPRAYRDAAKYLRKAEALIAPQDKPNQWHRYLRELRERHARKSRLMEILDGLEGKPIVSKRPGM